jgi:glycosyltransferase involved in cell wall biosynthesis
MTRQPSESILFLLNSSPKVWRAMEELNLRLCAALLEKNVRPVVALSNAVPDEIRSRWESIGIDIHILTYRHRWAFIWALRRLIKQYSITAVHIRFYRCSSLIPWIVRACGVKRIFFTDAEGGVDEAQGVKRFLKRVRMRLLSAPLSRVIAISEFVSQRLKDSGVPFHKIRTVYNGVDLSRFTPDPHARDALVRKLGLKGTPLIATTVSRLWKIKGVDVLLDACHRVRKEAEIHLIIAGAGPEEPALRRQCEALGLSHCVTWVGATAEPETFMRGADVFLLGSTGEAFGNVLVEAMACAVPIVASRSGGIPEIVIDGQCGLLATPADADSFAEKISQLAHNPEQRCHLATNALKRAVLFGVDQAVENTVDVYRDAGLVQEG